jgi:ribosomal-protein-alanine N-acetyltransferase
MRLVPSFPWRTAQLELFVLEPEHVSDAYVAWLNDPNVNRFLESRFVRHTFESVREFVANALVDPKVLMLGIRRLEDGRHIGNIKLGPIDTHHGLGEIGLMIGDRSAWGRGVGTEAIQLVFRIATEQLALRKITAGCYASNIASRKAFEKAGFHLEAIRRAHFLLDGCVEDLLLLARHRDSTGSKS